jgi:hypothetical protein
VNAENLSVKFKKQLDKLKNAPKPIKIDLTQQVNEAKTK